MPAYTAAIPFLICGYETLRKVSLVHVLPNLTPATITENEPLGHRVTITLAINIWEYLATQPKIWIRVGKFVKGTGNESS